MPLTLGQAGTKDAKERTINWTRTSAENADDDFYFDLIRIRIDPRPIPKISPGKQHAEQEKQAEGQGQLTGACQRGIQHPAGLRENYARNIPG
jgi:hypothetical protein